MSLYILRWDPNISSYKTQEHLELISHIKKNEQPASFDWSIREYENLKKDDMFIMQQVGTDNDGIAMIGKFKDSCYEEESWRKDGSTVHYADMWILDAFDCNTDNPLPAKRYEKLFPEIKWHGGHSGVVVEENLNEKLLSQIEKDLIKAGIWKKGEIDKFLAFDFEKDTAGKLLFSAKDKYLNNKDEESFFNFIDCLLDSKVLIPMHVEKAENGDTHCMPMILTNDDEQSPYPIFSNEEQIGDHYQKDDCELYEISVPLAVDIIKEDENTKGLILDPFTTPFLIDRKMLDGLSEIMDTDENDNEDDEE